MYNVNGIKAILVQNNRGISDYYDDQDKRQVNIKVCPYSKAKGYFIVKGKTPVKEGDQLIFGNHTFSIIEVRDSWIWNKLANIIIAVK